MATAKPLRLALLDCQVKQDFLKAELERERGARRMVDEALLGSCQRIDNMRKDMQLIYEACEGKKPDVLRIVTLTQKWRYTP